MLSELHIQSNLNLYQQRKIQKYTFTKFKKKNRELKQFFFMSGEEEGTEKRER